MIAGRMRRTLRGQNAILNVFEMWVALAAVISGIIFFYQPASIDGNALSLTVGHSLATVWNVMYFAAGLVIWFGLLRPSPKWEIIGLSLLGSATSISGVALWSVFGIHGAASAITLLALTVAAWLRASFVMRTAVRLAGESDVAHTH